MRQYTGWVCFVLLLGAVVGFHLGRPGAAAQTVDNKSTRWLAGTVSYGQFQDAFVLFDTQTNRLVAYSISPQKRLELAAVREITWDLRPVEWGKQEPGVKEMHDAYQESMRKEQEKAEQERLKQERKKK